METIFNASPLLKMAALVFMIKKEVNLPSSNTDKFHKT